MNVFMYDCLPVWFFVNNNHNINELTEKFESNENSTKKIVTK